MPQFCTCGAELPTDSLFCHKCGKPQRDDILPEPEEQALPPPPPPPVAAAPPAATTFGPSFHNPIAVRIGLLAASLATVLNLVLLYGFAIWLVAAGFFSVYLFSRRTGQFLSIRAGARMGWITGILSFAIITVLFTLSVVSVASRSEGLAGFYREQLGSMATRDPNVEQAIRMLETGTGQATLFISSLIFLFMIITVFCAAGGALGAKVLEKE